MKVFPLDRDDTTEMLRCMLAPSPTRHSLADLAAGGGNPLFVEELVSVLAEGGVLEPTADAAAALARTLSPQPSVKPFSLA